MNFYKEYTLKNGEKLVIRNATSDDGEAVATATNIVHKETNYLGFSYAERSFTKEDEIEYIESMNSSPRSAFLVAEYKGEIIGTTQIRPKSNYEWRKHICELGIAVESKCWGLGIAGRMMMSILECAKAAGFEQMELNVVSENTRAINLYKSFGFEMCGTMRNAYKYSPRHYADRYMMQKFLT